MVEPATPEAVRRQLERAEAALEFLRRDQEPMERRYRWANAEVDALRELVRDFVESVCPIVPKLNFVEPGSWQDRARKAIAGVSIQAKTDG